MTWRPPSARDRPDDRFDRLHEGVPPWLVEPLVARVNGFIAGYSPMGDRYFNDELMHEMELAVRFDPPLSWERGGRTALESVLQRFEENLPDAMDVLDFLLRWLGPRYPWHSWNDSASVLKRVLDAGDSAWDVTTIPDADADDERERYLLTRRVAGPVFDAVVEVGSVSERAGQHLREAWTQLLGVHPDPSAAYQSAVAAVEVAAKPVVSPDNPGTTLGTILRDLKAKPSKWTFELGDMQLIIDMVSALWDSQLRHGDEAAPASETQEQADAAVHLALTLVRWFTTGAVGRA